MSANSFVNTTVLFYPSKSPKLRLVALWYFTILMIIWNVLGHTVLGFEQSWCAPVVGVGSALFMQFLLEWVDAKAKNRPLRFTGSWADFFNFLPAALIPGFACAMLIYTNERLWPIAFAVVLSIGSKLIFRVPVAPGRTQHIFNPSNFGVAATLVLFPEVGFAPPYHFTENLVGLWNWVLPGVILLTGLVIHSLFTGRMPLVVAWVLGFVLQAQVRAQLFGTPPIVPLTPMTSAAFILFTLYMIPDPATTPLHPWRQVLFGFSVAMVYGLIQILHIVYGLFFALVAVCVIRGLCLYLYFTFKSPTPALTEPAPAPTALSGAALPGAALQGAAQP